MVAEIISVGTELLMGQIVDTNAQFLSKRLSELGYTILYKSTVGDNPARMKATMQTAVERSDIVITTGGLGPTEDDLTKEMAAEIFGKTLYMHEESKQRILENFKRWRGPATENNFKQAMMPEGAIVLPNDKGTAPGCILEDNGRRIIVLPGPPREMTYMFDTYVLSYLEQLSPDVLRSVYLRVKNVGESAVADKLSQLIDQQTNPTIATYASTGDVTLRITAKCKKGEDATLLLDPVVKAVYDILGADVYAEGQDALEIITAKKLIASKKTLAIAESCTGGLIASSLVSYPGASAFLLEGNITYSNESKVRLGVSPALLSEYGAVSREVAMAMAEQARLRANADIGLSTTGIAGPTGGTPDKPEGTVWIGISDKDGTSAFHYLASRNDRAQNRLRFMINALHILIERL